MKCRGLLLVLPLLCTLLVLSCNPREWFFRPNPNLTLLVSHNAPGRSGGSHYAASWSPDGQVLYYLQTTEALYYLEAGGSPWNATATGSPRRRLSEDEFSALGVSHDGSKLGLVTRPARREHGELVILDLQTLRHDTLRTGRTDILDVVFGRKDTLRVFYASAGDGVRSIRLDGTDDRPELPTVRTYFDLTPSDSVVFVTKRGYGPKVTVDPAGKRLAGALDGRIAPTDIWILDMQTGDTTWLNAKPYYKSGLSHPRWSPDGSKLVFTAQRLTTGFIKPAEGAELWMLENIPGD
jgi:Tol biopolymer transport system component